MDESNGTGTEVANTGTNSADTGTNVTDETGSVTQEEITAALGSRYQTVELVSEEGDDADKSENSEDNNGSDAEDEAGDEATDEEDTEEAAKPPVKQDLAPPDLDTKDFSFTVEDANGTSYKISPGDSIEDVLRDFEPKNNGQIIAVLEQLREAKDAQKAYEFEQAQEVSKAAQAERVAELQTNWESEIKALQADKRIPTTAKGADNERVAEVFKFMAEENDKRIASNRPTIGSFEDALDKLENKEARDAKVEADKTEKENARKNGALVGGSSAPATSGAPVYQAGSARNVNQAMRNMGLL